MEIEVKADRKLDNGNHSGIITAVQYRTEPFEYTDILIELDNKMVVKAGYPTTITPSSRLGRLLTEFGVKLEVGKKLDPGKVLIGKRCNFMIMNKKTENGTFPEIVKDSICESKPEDVF